MTLDAGERGRSNSFASLDVGGGPERFRGETSTQTSTLAGGVDSLSPPVGAGVCSC